ncbi:22908_t:CDS:2 [Gigaspora margarita]|uniref:22908_t:CDS:1 n=1 Tax=Gigaspora margarita TaxID=4874 RepID=A0ABM8VY97_GIGMA|nr:22908_t:CDS:2 [Gigaspora margarita]
MLTAVPRKKKLEKRKGSVNNATTRHLQSNTSDNEISKPMIRKKKDIHKLKKLDIGKKAHFTARILKAPKTNNSNAPTTRHRKSETQK